MKKQCVTCKYAQFKLKPSGKRDLYSGKCLYEINLPHCFLNYRGEMPIPQHVNKYTKENCPCWCKA